MKICFGHGALQTLCFNEGNWIGQVFRITVHPTPAKCHRQTRVVTGWGLIDTLDTPPQWFQSNRGITEIPAHFTVVGEGLHVNE